MALYQQIMKVPGLSGNAFQRQSQLYAKLGNPMGKYRGSLAQNSYLINQINKGNLGKAAAPKAPVASGSLAQKYAQAVLPPGGIKTPTNFGQVLPLEKLVNRPLVQQFAYSRVDPEIQRQRAIAQDDLMTNLSNRGGLRFGTANVEKQRLQDAYSRQREEMALPFVQEGMNRLQDYYNELEKEYYKDPNAFQYKPLDVNSFLTNRIA